MWIYTNSPACNPSAGQQRSAVGPNSGRMAGSHCGSIMGVQPFFWLDRGCKINSGPRLQNQQRAVVGFQLRPAVGFQRRADGGIPQRTIIGFQPWSAVGFRHLIPKEGIIIIIIIISIFKYGNTSNWTVCKNWHVAKMVFKVLKWSDAIRESILVNKPWTIFKCEVDNHILLLHDLQKNYTKKYNKWDNICALKNCILIK